MKIKEKQKPQEVSSTFQSQAWCMSDLWQGRWNPSCCCEVPSGPNCHIFFPMRQGCLSAAGRIEVLATVETILFFILIFIHPIRHLKFMSCSKDFMWLGVFSLGMIFFFYWSYIRLVPLAYSRFPQLFANEKCISCTKSRYILQTLIQLIWHGRIHLELIHTISFPYLACEGWS